MQKQFSEHGTCVTEHPQTKVSFKLNFTPYIKINSKWITNLNVKCKAIQTSRKNIGESLQDLGPEKEFSDLRTKP